MRLSCWLRSLRSPFRRGRSSRQRHRNKQNLASAAELLEDRTLLAAPHPFDLSTLDGSNGFRLDGIDVNDRSGHSVSTAGDVNGDGYADILVGAPNADPGGEAHAGETYVVFGSGSSFAASLDLSTLDGSNGFRLDGMMRMIPPAIR
ncbi:integrin alpha [Planctomycetaceae bacterium]|nr:integrin alpha [Planctomycetaceae bacterium]